MSERQHPEVSLYPHAIGAWTVYSRQSLLTAGLLDEHFTNAWEHIEHTLRLAEHGFTTGAGQFADAADSERWLAEIPNSLDRSAIRSRPDWQRNIVDGLVYWRTAHPSTFDAMFGPGTYLEGWAASLLVTA